MDLEVNQAAPPLLTSRARSFSKATGIGAVSVGLAVLAGWRFDIQGLKSIYPGLTTMKPNTALAFVLCGLAVWVFQSPGGNERAFLRRSLANAAAATVLVVGLLTLFEYGFHWQPGLDTYLFRKATAGGPFPGRMSPVSALCFVLIGAALLLLHANRPATRRLSRFASLMSGIAALMALFGYAYSITVFYKLSSYTGTAVHTAAVFALLSVGILCARPDEGLIATLLKRSPGGTVMRRALPISLAAAFFLGWLRLEGQHHGLFGTEMGVAILVSSACAIFALSIAWAARTVDAAAELLAAKQQLPEMLQLMVERTPEYAVIMLGPAGNIATWNSAAERIKGYRAEEIIGKHFSILYSPEDVAGGKPGRELEVAARKGVYEDEGWRMRQDGSRFWANVVITALQDQRGDLRGFGKITRDLTERKRAELEILKNKDVLEKFVEYAPAGIAMLDHNMRYVVASRRWYEDCGINDKSIIGKNHYEVFPALSEHWKAATQRGIAGETVKGEDEWVALDDRKHIVRWEIHPWKDAGSATGIIIFEEDITELKRSSDQFRLALEAAPTGMIMIDQHGKIVLVNAQVDSLFGYDRAELLGQSIEVLVPERFRGRHPEFRANFFSDPKTRAMGAGRDLHGLRKDGTEMPIEIGLTPLETPEGWFVISSVVDITERKQAAANQFRLAIEAAPTGMILTDQRGKIVLVNAQVDKLFGYERPELMGRSIEMLMPERFRSHHVEHRKDFSAHPKVRPADAGHDLFGLRKDGTEIPVEIGLNPLETADGKFVLSSVVDITERKHAGQERESLLIKLQTSNAELGSTLREREILLQEIHHRVKNNLQVISSLMSLQVRRTKDPATRDALREGQARVQAISLVHEMLYQSRDYAKVSFSEYVRRLANNVFFMVGVDPGCILLDLAIDDVALAVDKAIPCGLVINELITNALKHAFPGGRHGTIRVELGRESTGQLRLSVEDNGVGMPPDSDIRQTQSLGLHLVSTLAEQLGAELEMTRDKGTHFRLTFAPDQANDARNSAPSGASLETAG